MCALAVTLASVAPYCCRLFILAVLFLCLGSTVSSAQAYSKYSVSNPDGTTKFYGVSNSKNTKIYEGKNWFFKVTSISFSSSSSVRGR